MKTFFVYKLMHGLFCKSAERKFSCELFDDHDSNIAISGVLDCEVGGILFFKPFNSRCTIPQENRFIKR